MASRAENDHALEQAVPKPDLKIGDQRNKGTFPEREHQFGPGLVKGFDFHLFRFRQTTLDRKISIGACDAQMGEIRPAVQQLVAGDPRR